jgi:hypothetical protein
MRFEGLLDRQTWGEITQVGRALNQLGVRQIGAHSPEARGRSERMFRTLQDRVPKVLRLAGITTIEAANVWLKAYIAEHNACFAVKPEQEGTMFVTDRDGAYREILCVQEQRVVANDNPAETSYCETECQQLTAWGKLDKTARYAHIAINVLLTVNPLGAIKVLLTVNPLGRLTTTEGGDAGITQVFHWTSRIASRQTASLGFALCRRRERRLRRLRGRGRGAGLFASFAWPRLAQGNASLAPNVRTWPKLIRRVNPLWCRWS